MTRHRQPWEQQEVETPKAFHAFAHYRDLNPAIRSLDTAYARHRASCLVAGQGGAKTIPSQWKHWCAKYEWVERVRAYDRHRDTQLREVGEAETLESQRRWLQIARALQEDAWAAISSKNLNEEAVRELRLLIVEAVRMERESLEFSATGEQVRDEGIQLFLEATQPSPREVAALFAEMESTPTANTDPHPQNDD